MTPHWPKVRLAELLRPGSRTERVDPAKEYALVGVRLDGKGPFHRETVLGSTTSATVLFRLQAGEFIYSRLFAWRGAFGVVGPELDGHYASGEFPTFLPADDRLDLNFLRLWFRLPSVLAQVIARSSGGTPTTRNRLREDRFLSLEMPVPPLDEQRRIVARASATASLVDTARALAMAANDDIRALRGQAVEAWFARGQWSLQSLRTLLLIRPLNGLSTRPYPEPPGVPILRISAATSRGDAVVDESDVRYLRSDRTDPSAYVLQPEDLLACRFNGNLRFVGRFALFEGRSGESRVYPDKLIRFRVDRDRVLPAFVCAAMNARSARLQIESMAATTAGNIGISATDLLEVRVPVPPLPEQARLVTLVREVDGWLAELRRVHSASFAELDHLQVAMLHGVLASASEP